ncbi:hypothetical protein SARC_05323 [Sphaeroforma arctica JP610]|uniref:Uncharacterized protein n=1 Tax=Sphaeroforma arctica JP610 TaxID=667725 RepID=A0A0L0G0N1_9EUKA|nr:hypothetical protein SARC_05323 [Sphaeroforma arctica JP610]KNC82396.1 hypothetical protein SARC_05323 [Sphaeroforma arctica JP610]|eukprot:XP_014156298.1 hypothetical protein SARC_05323 [Sphaeroforma arctica JP610]
MCTKTKSDGGSGNSIASTKKVAKGEKEKECPGSPAVAKKIKTGVITKSAESTGQPDINSCPRPVVANECDGEDVVVGDKAAANGKQICSKVSTTAAFVNLAKGECSNGNDIVDTEKIATGDAAHPKKLGSRMDAHIRTLPLADSSNYSFGSEKKDFSSQAMRELTVNLHMLTKTLERLVKDESTIDREVDPQQTNQCEKKAAVTAKQKSRNDKQGVQQNSFKMKHVQRQPVQLPLRRHTRPWFYSQVYVQDRPQQSLYSTQSDQGLYRKTPYVQYYTPPAPLATHRMSDPAPRPSHTQMYAVSENYAMPPAYLPQQHTHIHGPHQLPYAYVPSGSSALPFTGMHAQHRQPDVNIPAYGPQTAMHPSQLHTHAPVHRPQQQTEGTGVSKVPASYRPQTLTSAVQSVHLRCTRGDVHAGKHMRRRVGDMARQNAQVNPDTSTSSACEWNTGEADRTAKNDGVVTVVPRIGVQSAAPAHLEGHTHSKAFLEAQAQRLVHTHSRAQTHAHAHGYNHMQEPNIYVQFHGGSTVVSHLRLPVDSLSYKYNPEAPKSSPMDLDRGLKNDNSDASDLTSQGSDPFVQGYMARRGLKV